MILVTVATMILVTGGAGFIGANFVLDWLADRDEPVVNLDKLTYAGNLGNLAAARAMIPAIMFVRGDIGDRALVDALLAAASAARDRQFRRRESTSTGRSTVRRPSSRPTSSARSALLEAARAYWCGAAGAGERARIPLPARFDRRGLRLARVRADRLSPRRPPYAPNSPYSASKAASDHLVRAYHHTYGLPTLTTNCSNNYGPYQFPEKLIPLMIVNAIAGKPLPVYGDGQNVRDWLYVDDHCAAIRAVLAGGRAGRDVQHRRQRREDEPRRRADDMPRAGRTSVRAADYAAQISFVTDRPGHDRRYAIDASKIRERARLEAARDLRIGHRADGALVSGQRHWLAAVREQATTRSGSRFNYATALRRLQ